MIDVTINILKLLEYNKLSGYNSNILYYTVAISCAGKSTFCNQYSDKIQIVSLDKIREENPNTSSVPIALEQIKELLKKGDVLFDANNSKLEHRELLKSMFPNSVAIKLTFDLNISLEKLERHHERNEKMYLTKEIIERQYTEYLNDIDNLSYIEIKDFEKCIQE